MPNWKKFIIKENRGSNAVTCLAFDKKIYKYSECLSFFNRHPFNSFLPGDEVEIDIDKVVEFRESLGRV